MNSKIFGQLNYERWAVISKNERPIFSLSLASVMSFISCSIFCIIFVLSRIRDSKNSLIIDDLENDYTEAQVGGLRKVLQLIRKDKSPSITKTTIVCDDRSTSICQTVAKLISAKFSSSVSIFNSEKLISAKFSSPISIYSPKYSAINLFSNLNILCFHSLSNFFTFVSKTNLTWLVLDSYYLMAIKEDSSFLSPSKADLILKTLWTSFNLFRVMIFHHKQMYVYDLNLNRTRLLNIIEVRSMKDLFKVTDLRGRPLRITLFPIIPEVMQLADGRYTGYAYSLLMAISQKLNFSPIVAAPSDDCKYGGLDNGTYVGGLGDVSYGRSDVAANGYFVNDDSPIFMYLTYFNVINVCVVVPKAGSMPKYVILFTCFPYTVWGAIAFAFFATYSFQMVAKTFNLAFVQSGRNSSGSIFLTTLSATLNLPLPARQFLHLRNRIILFTYLSLMYVMVSSFQASLVTLLSVSKHYRDLETLEEFSASPLDIRVPSPTIKRTLGEDFFMYIIADRIKVGRQNETEKVNFGFLLLTVHSKLNQFKNFVSQKGNALYNWHIMSECPYAYYTSYVVSKRFPFVSEFNSVIKRLVEAGFIKKWDMDVTYELNADYVSVSNGTPSIRPARSEHKPFSLEDLGIAFIILTLGNSFGFVVFIFEMFVFRWKNSVPGSKFDTLIVSRKSNGSKR